MEELITKMEAAYADMKAYADKLKAATSDEDKQKFKTLHEGSVEKFTEAKASYEEAKANLEIETTIQKAKADAKAVTQANISAEPTQPEPVVSGKAEKEADKKSLFLKYVTQTEKGLSDREMDQIACTDRRFQKTLGPGCVWLPKSMLSKVLGAKVVLSTDTQGITSPSDSGAANLLAPDYRAQLVQEPLYEPNLFDLARQEVAFNGSFRMPRLEQGPEAGRRSGVAFTWKTEEGVDKGETEPTFGDFEIQTHELSGWTATSLQALWRSAIDLEQTIYALFGGAARDEFSEVILNGNGTTQPQGILTNPNTSGVQVVSRDTLGEVGWADIVKLAQAVHRGFRVGGRYIMADEVEGSLNEQTDNEGRPLFTADNTVGTGPRTILNRFPTTVHEDEDVELGDLGDIIFGNMQNYIFAVEQDFAIARSDHAEFKKGQVVFRFMTHVGGKMLHPRGFAILDEGTSP